MENLENISKKNCGTFHGLFCITEMKSGAKTLLKTLQAISNTVSVKEEPMDEDDPDSANHSTTKSSTATSSAGKNDLITRFSYCFFLHWVFGSITCILSPPIFIHSTYSMKLASQLEF